MRKVLPEIDFEGQAWFYHTFLYNAFLAKNGLVFLSVAL